MKAFENSRNFSLYSNNFFLHFSRLEYGRKWFAPDIEKAVKTHVKAIREDL